MEISVIGGGLAGSEAAYQIARMGGKAVLYEMRPVSRTPAHKTDRLSELVCSNSLKSRELTNAHGLLKAELRLLGSLIIEAADACAIPGGKALVVDRGRFAEKVTSVIENHPALRVVREERTVLPREGTIIVATGPLTAPALGARIRAMTGMTNLHFFDAISPIIDGETIDMDHAFFANRYSVDGTDYLNCPLTQEEYGLFYDALLAGRRVDLREFEETPYFEGCLPIEVMADRGRKTLLFGPMKPVGLFDERTDKEPYAVLQLRREDASGRMYNMVGFQTKLTYPEQERVFRLIPALREAKFFRYGSIHRNTFINSPLVLKGLKLRSDERIFFAGQLTGVEGYMESTAVGLVAGLAALSHERGKGFEAPPPTTCTGALCHYIATERKDFQPMNINFGLLEGYNKRKKEMVAQRALATIAEWRQRVEEGLT
ncbi:MAG: methylenetetrahydrofolate--tRNA-(uracil(54)-C(5))-methyltransferase (FADH(2)-oxidizing) TrmFO [Syntrophorhabdales bacterium]